MGPSECFCGDELKFLGILLNFLPVVELKYRDGYHKLAIYLIIQALLFFLQKFYLQTFLTKVFNLIRT